MRKTISLSLFLALASCSRHMVHVTYPEKFEGLTQLVLASQTTTVSFVEDVSKSLLAIFRSHAQVKVVSSVTYDFYLDFEKDGYDTQLDRKNQILHFEAPPIRVKKPVVHESTVSFPETGIFVNENKEAVKILEQLTERFITEGEVFLEEERVKNKCHEKLEEYLAGLCNEFGYDVESIEVTFRKKDDRDPTG